ncbi:MAG: RagB/SusD family nutrient uptake outer membrane protein, partial [Tannerellaceae bacterium]|nr:RagB/SusD family nutrient uptake outer membrane protein [Tannerellaceae bacterium]
MKAIKIYGLLIGLACLIGACDSYLDVELQNQITLEEVFSSRGTTEQYLANVYSYLPKEHDMFTDGSVVARSDEAHFSWLSGIDWLNFINGSWTTSLWAYNTWADSYEGINQATVFMNNIENVPDEQISQTDKAIMKAEARFIRAYLYFYLLRKYGPVFVWGDQDADNLIRPESIDRHPLETNVEFILSEYDKAIAILPAQISDVKWYGRITKGMAMAAKSRMTLYMARPLFNGCTLYKGMKNKDGEFIFPQTPDPSKWEDAARAAKVVIDMGIYELYEDKTETDPFKRSIRSYMDVIFEQWNSEIIWGRFWDGGWEYNVRCAPPKVVREGYGGYCPSMKLVDTYPMSESGRYPVTGYQSNGYPIVDPLSGYSNEGFTENYLHPLDDFATIKAHNSCVGRDARFYASVLANGMYWLNTYKGQKLVTFYDGGTSSYATAGDVVKVGFLWRRMFNPLYN